MLCVGFHKMFNNKYKKVKKQPLAVRKWTGPGVKFCVSDFRQSQEWRWKAGRILAWIPW